MHTEQKNRGFRQRGFSLMELMIVMAIILVVSAFALPRIQTAIAQMRLRATATNVNGLVQQLRMQAVRSNQALSIRSAVVNNQPTLYIDSNLSATFNPGEPSVPMPTDTVVFDGTGGPVTAPTTAVVIPPYINYANAPVLAFNTRGLPCNNPPVCNTLAPYVIYMRQTRPLSGPGYAAVVVTPAGRVQALTYQPGSGGTQWH
jgi:prepilin-type N-terminal cleavage/methylation domain-containing protein